MYTKITKKLALLMSAAFIAGLAIFSYADSERISRMTQYLELSDEQVLAIEALGNPQEEGRGEAWRTKKEVEKLVVAGEVDAAANLAAESVRTKIYGYAENRAALAEILTPAQLEEWEDLRDRFRNRR